MQTIAVTKLRELALSVPPSPGRPLHLSAASGLACIRSLMYVVADDELHLGVFREQGDEPGRLIRLFDGELPDGKSDRKKEKPDLEALALLPAHGSHPHGALLAVGSGSRPNRCLGAVIGLDAQGAAREPPRVVDLSPILVPLGERFPALNVEGAVVIGGELCLLQRGTTRHLDNCVIRYPLMALLDALGSARAGAIRPSAIVPFDLGQIDGVPLTFTDAAALPDGSMIFSAVAEDTDNTYDDGLCKGAAIGRIDPSGRLLWVRPLDRPYKVEGVDARVDGGAIRLLLVTDADDPEIAAGLFTAIIS